MNKKIINIILIIIFIFLVTGCHFSINTNIKDEEESNYKESVGYEVNVQVNLENNETASEFSKLLPLTVNMNELNGNEKYVYLDKPLKTNPYNPKHIEAGDVMLYGNNCLVIFYKSFDTSYSYTKIGHIDNLPDLGNGDVNVKIDIS